MKRVSSYRVDDFLNDQDFVCWVQNPDPVSEAYWRAVMEIHPEKRVIIEESILIVQSFQVREPNISTEEIDELWKRVRRSTLQKKRRIYLRHYGMVGSIGLLFLLGYWLLQRKSVLPEKVDYAAIEKPVLKNDVVNLILADSSVLALEEADPVLVYSTRGDLQINAREIERKPKAGKGRPEFNQLVVPYGKRSNVVFSDGSQIWVNSGSRVIYPVEFAHDRREIFLEGEAFLEVTHDPARPFLVKSEKMQVEVLGTSFNYSAYAGEEVTRVVLVDGSVQAKVKNQPPVLLVPSEMIDYSESRRRIEIKSVNVQEYISWKDGWLLCNSDPMAEIVRKLERYYNVPLIFKDSRARDLRLSGKLDLNERLDQVLKVMETTAPVRFAQVGDTIQISMY